MMNLCPNSLEDSGIYCKQAKRTPKETVLGWFDDTFRCLSVWGFSTGSGKTYESFVYCKLGQSSQAQEEKWHLRRWFYRQRFFKHCSWWQWNQRTSTWFNLGHGHGGSSASGESQHPSQISSKKHCHCSCGENLFGSLCTRFILMATASLYLHIFTYFTEGHCCRVPPHDVYIIMGSAKNEPPSHWATEATKLHCRCHVQSESILTAVLVPISAFGVLRVGYHQPKKDPWWNICGALSNSCRL